MFVFLVCLFFMIRLRLWILEEKITDLMAIFALHLIKIINMTYPIGVNLDHPAEVAFVRFLLCKVTLFLRLHILSALWKRFVM